MLIAVVAVVGAHTYLLSPLLPDLARDLFATLGRIGLAAACYAAATGLTALLLGPSADRWPRPRVLAASALLLAAGFLLCAAATSWPVLALGQGLAGLAAGLLLPTVYALATDAAGPAERSRVLGRVLLGWSVALILGVPAGALAGDRLGWRGTFLLLAGLAGLAAIGLGRLRERRDATAPAGGLAAVLRLRAARRWWAVGFLDMVAFYASWTYLGARVRDALGWSADLAALPAVLYGLGFALPGLLGRGIDRLGPARALPLGLALLALVYLALPAASRAAGGLALAMLGWGVGQHLALNGFVSLLAAVDPTRRGGLMAVNSAVTYAGFALGAASVGPLVDRFGFPAAAVTSALSSGLALLLAAPRPTLSRRA